MSLPAESIRIGDLRVRRLAFGAVRLTGPNLWGEPQDREEAKRVLRRAIELGVELIDTADSYGPEVSEDLIAQALHPYPPNLVIATKGGLVRYKPADWIPRGTPDHLKQACEASLKRLRVDRIDLYQLHAPDPEVPLEISIGALAELREQGKIRHVGLSNVAVDQLVIARQIVPIVWVQNQHFRPRLRRCSSNMRARAIGLRRMARTGRDRRYPAAQRAGTSRVSP